MTRVFIMIALSLVVILPAQALADAFGQSTASKRKTLQVVNCMRKRMSADKLISYNAATTLCKSQVHNLSNNSMAIAVVASDSPTKP